MNQIGRYLLRNLTVATLFVTVGLAAAIWLTQSLRLVQLVVEGGAPFAMFLKMAVLTFPTFLSLVLPIALLSAVLFTYNKLTMDSELVVMRAAGLGPMALARPALLLGLGVALVCYALTVSIGPAAQRELVRMREEVRSEYSAVLLREGTFNDVGEGLTVYIRERGRNGELRGLLIHDIRSPEAQTTIVAEYGMLMDVGDNPRVVVSNGTQMKFYEPTGKLEWLEFGRYTVDLQVLRKQLGTRWPDPRERPIGELFRISNDPLDQEFKSRLRAELHSRLSTPLLALAFTVIAMCALLPGEFSRRGRASRIAGAAVAALVLQSAVLGVANLVGKNPTLTPLLYATCILPTVLGLWYMKNWRIVRRALSRRLAPPAPAAAE
ncbi:LPS export ABC transporter permease LptF [Aerophototrophica crusticola]|uniref:LPS export ABC transporter permease LptF n=1 Tax=Aerophototrophica crusticola TaxID=1709002 RepID=A0A858R4W6_9PROT|nr:LPS export ABC transporter permease LptF [Rhodospirillaceae bacterium B3]